MSSTSTGTAVTSAEQNPGNGNSCDLCKLANTPQSQPIFCQPPQRFCPATTGGTCFDPSRASCFALTVLCPIPSSQQQPIGTGGSQSQQQPVTQQPQQPQQPTPTSCVNSDYECQVTSHACALFVLFSPALSTVVCLSVSHRLISYVINAWF